MRDDLTDRRPVVVFDGAADGVGEHLFSEPVDEELLTAEEHRPEPGHAVDGCADLPAARQLLAGQRYAVVIADLQLSARGEEEGLEILALAGAQSPPPRVILLSAHAEPEVREQALSRGADAFLLKPLPLSEVAATVELPLAPVTAEDAAAAKQVIARVRQGVKPAPKFLDQVQAFKAADVADRLGKPLAVEVQVIAVGDDLAWVSLPGEIFVQLGLSIKAGSPFKQTMIAELANGSIGYVPTKVAVARLRTSSTRPSRLPPIPLFFERRMSTSSPVWASRRSSG